MFVSPGTLRVNAIHSSHSLFLLDLVLQVDGAAATGSPLCVAKCALSSEEREKLATGRSDEESPGMRREERYYRKSSIKLSGGLTYFRSISGGGLIETGGLFERGDFFNLEKTMVSVPYKELEIQSGKSQVQDGWRSCSGGSQSNPNFQLVNQSTRSFTVVIDKYSLSFIIEE